MQSAKWQEEIGYFGFCHHPELSLRISEPTSIRRAVGFNHVQVRRFYDILQETYKKQHINPLNIWNVDETGLTTVYRPGKVRVRRRHKSHQERKARQSL